MRCRRFANGGFEGSFIVGHDVEHIRFATGRFGACCEGVAVRVANVARARNLARRYEFAANGNNRYARLAIDRHLQHSAACQKTDARGRDYFALVHDGFAGASFFACFAHVVAFFGLRGKCHAAARFAIAFHHAHDFVFHHGVKAARKGGARHDTHALASLCGALKYAARRHLVDDFECHGRFCRGFREVASAYGVAIHGRMGERAYVNIAFQIGGGNAPCGVEQVNGFRLERRHAREYELARLLQRNHFRHGQSLPCATRAP